MRERILVVDDDVVTRALVTDVLSRGSFEVALAESGEQGLDMVTEYRPDLILLDLNLPGMSGTQVLTHLRASAMTRYVPIILVTVQGATEDVVRHLDAGADDYVLKPFQREELLARIRVALRRNHELTDLNALTHLPGNNAIEREMVRRFATRVPFAGLYCDLDSFKAFNDHYGFKRGDEAIRALAATIQEAIDTEGAHDTFIGHIGGDDFIALVDSEHGEAVAHRIIRGFAEKVTALSDPEDVARGFIESTDRAGKPARFDLLSVSVAVVSTTIRALTSAAEFAHVAAELKHIAKAAGSSSIAVERRTDPIRPRKAR